VAEQRAGWWWIDRWRKSTAYTDMTLAEQGAYRNLLDELWLRGGLLPNDERILAKISGDALSWPSVREAVMCRFEVTADGRSLRNETHDEVAAGGSKLSTSQAKKGEKRAAGAARDSSGRFQPKDQPDQPPGQPESSREAPAGSSLRTPDPDPFSVSVTGADEPPQPPAAREEPAEERAGEVTPIDAGDVLAQTEYLAAEWIAAGGYASREWRRGVKGELRARGIDAGSAVVRERIVAQRERSAADAARAQAVAVVSDLVARSSAPGRKEWAAVMSHLEPTLNSHSFGVWFRPLVALGIVSDDEGDRLLVGAPNEQFVTWVGRNYQDQIAAAVTAAGLELSVVVVLEPPSSAIAR
jgi:uncharacterized protein YdaU (DUF1376 family)